MHAGMFALTHKLMYVFFFLFLHFSLKAEWMYSQSKGRHFNVGQHDELLSYLLSICPLHPGEDWEEDKKLNLILSKVQEHQQSLRDPGSGGKSSLKYIICTVYRLYMEYVVISRE